MKVAFQNTTGAPIYIGSKLLQPGATREVDEDLIPAHLLQNHVPDAGEMVPPAGTAPEPAEPDPLQDQATQWVIENRKASVSALQRGLGIGQRRAAILIKAMESAGVVSAPDAAGVRTVLAPEKASALTTEELLRGVSDEQLRSLESSTSETTSEGD